MGYWSIIVPEATTNRVTNPSVETNTTGWTNLGMASMADAGAASRVGE